MELPPDPNHSWATSATKKPLQKGNQHLVTVVSGVWETIVTLICQASLYSCLLYNDFVVLPLNLASRLCFAREKVVESSAVVSSKHRSQEALCLFLLSQFCRT